MPGAVGQGQDQEEDSSQDEDSPATAHTGHRPGHLVVQRDGVVAFQEGEDGLAEDYEGQEHQYT